VASSSRRLASRPAALPLPAPPTLDAELIELGARFEPLVDRYNAARAIWARLSAIWEEIKPIAKAINAAPVTSIEGLRAKALAALYEVAPLSAGDTEFSFDDAYPFQHLFTAVAELCELKGKMAATGYALSDIARDDSDDEGEDA
jgi:hypothetical protein